ncbi:MAG: hypothetical protein K9L17_10325 [Clostridiales bacterium]|nr:hypothetical protein [Clostridiales bacterium]MCF8023077.1 hypothetical protein [Clostridiales bacterium]
MSGICEHCGKKGARVHLSFDSGESIHLCNDCHNDMVAKELGIKNYKDFNRNYFAKDVRGKVHNFNIRKLFTPGGILWQAVEIKDDEERGYEFKVHASFEDDPNKCLRKLYQKINKGLSKKYITTDELNGQLFYQLFQEEAVGRIEWDEEHDGRLPKLVIDGETYSWEQLGEMLMSYEGFNFKLQTFEDGDESI